PPNVQRDLKFKFVENMDGVIEAALYGRPRKEIRSGEKAASPGREAADAMGPTPPPVR
ncbi:MAG: hypothetical protein IMF16_01890, partial [Proteobacteria bacterium]|nr:hypothetical protein [Pseudomonadota bacterium]